MKIEFKESLAGEIKIKVVFQENKLEGKKIRLRFLLRAESPDSSSSHPCFGEHIVAEEVFNVSGLEATITVPKAQLQSWQYEGVKLKICYVADVFQEKALGWEKLGEAFFQDKKLFRIYENEGGGFPEGFSTGKQLFLPFSKSVNAKSLLYIAFSILLLGAFYFLSEGWFPKAADSALPRVMLMFPLFALLMLVGSLFNQVKLIVFRVLSSPLKIDAASQLKLTKLVESKALIDLHNVTIGLFGWIIEKYKYSHLVGRKYKYYDVTQANLAVSEKVFFEEKIADVPKGSSIEAAARQVVDFKAYFGEVIPAMEFDDSYKVERKVYVFVKCDEFARMIYEIPQEFLDYSETDRNLNAEVK